MNGKGVEGGGVLWLGMSYSRKRHNRLDQTRADFVRRKKTSTVIERKKIYQTFQIYTT